MPCKHCQNVMVGWVCDVCGEKKTSLIVLAGDGFCSGQLCTAVARRCDSAMGLPGSPYSNARYFTCTRPVGHEGLHIACNPMYHQHHIHSWEIVDQRQRQPLPEYEQGINRCRERGGAYICTRTYGHSGPHIAHSSPYRVVNTWDNNTRRIVRNAVGDVVALVDTTPPDTGGITCGGRRCMGETHPQCRCFGPCGFMCTLPAGHNGEHIACTRREHDVAHWRSDQGV